MKYFLILILVSIIFLFLACKICKSRKGYVKTSTELNAIYQPNLFLANRIPDCQKAIVWMDSVIIPDRVQIIKNKVTNRVKIVEGSFNILNDTISNFQSNKHLFYINDKCFIGQPSSKIIKVFCPDTSFVTLLAIDSINKSDDVPWKISLLANGVVGFSFDCKNGKVISTHISKSSIISH